MFSKINLQILRYLSCAKLLSWNTKKVLAKVMVTIVWYLMKGDVMFKGHLGQTENH